MVGRWSRVLGSMVYVRKVVRKVMVIRRNQGGGYEADCCASSLDGCSEACRRGVLSVGCGTVEGEREGVDEDGSCSGSECSAGGWSPE